MGALLVVVGHKLAEDQRQVLLVGHDEVVQALSAQRALLHGPAVARELRENSRIRRALPMPASPTTRIVWPPPPRTDSATCRRACSSSCRPICFGQMMGLSKAAGMPVASNLPLLRRIEKVAWASPLVAAGVTFEHTTVNAYLVATHTKGRPAVSQSESRRNLSSRKDGLAWRRSSPRRPARVTGCC